MAIDLASLPRKYQDQAAAFLYGNPKAGGKASGALAKRVIQHEPLGAPQAEAGHSGKYAVRVVSYRRRLLDEDNLAEKFHVDSLRYAGILPADSPDRCSISVRQEKVESKEDERTEIEIDLPFTSTP